MLSENWTGCVSCVEFDDKGRCNSHKDWRSCKTTAKKLHMKDVLTNAVRDYKLREGFRKLKGADNTLAKYEEADRLWDLGNSIRDAFNQNLK